MGNRGYDSGVRTHIPPRLALRAIRSTYISKRHMDTLIGMVHVHLMQVHMSPPKYRQAVPTKTMTYQYYVMTIDSCTYCSA